MWPWGHLAVGYLCYSALARWRFDRPPSDRAALLVAFGTQFPDLVDKPLAWTFHVLPTGRSLAHSLLTATAVCVLVWMYFRRRDRSALGIAFAVGYISHLFADAIIPFLNGQYGYLTYLVWPLLDLPSETTGTSLIAQVMGITLSPFFALQLAFFVFGVVVWVRDGCPGPSVLRTWFVSWRNRAAEH